MGDVVYVAQFVTDAIAESHGVDWRSPAGHHKKQNVITALSTQYDHIDVVSPVVLTGGGLGHEPPRTVASGSENATDEGSGAAGRDGDRDASVQVATPRAVTVAGWSPLNHLLLTVFATVAVWRRCRAEDVEAVVFYNFHLETAVPAVLAGALTGTASVIEYEDGLFVADAGLTRGVARLLRPTIGRALDGAVCVCGPLAGQVPTENTAIVRGFPSVGFPEGLPEPDTDDGPPVVMFAGHFDDVRGVHTFIDVVDDWDGPPVRFWISGHGTDEEVRRVERRIDEVDDDRLRFFGTLPWEQYKQRLVDAHVLVNCQDPRQPISEYTFPSKLLDFMASGAIVVTTDMSDLREALDDTLVVDGATAEELRQTVASVAADIDGLGPRAERASDWVAETCRHDAVGRTYGDVIEEATG